METGGNFVKRLALGVFDWLAFFFSYCYFTYALMELQACLELDGLRTTYGSVCRYNSSLMTRVDIEFYRSLSTGQLHKYIYGVA